MPAPTKPQQKIGGTTTLTSVARGRGLIPVSKEGGSLAEPEKACFLCVSTKRGSPRFPRRPLQPNFPRPPLDPLSSYSLQLPMRSGLGLLVPFSSPILELRLNPSTRDPFSQIAFGFLSFRIHFCFHSSSSHPTVRHRESSDCNQ